MYAREPRAHVNDLHASMLFSLGLDDLRVDVGSDLHIMTVCPIR